MLADLDDDEEAPEEEEEEANDCPAGCQRLRAHSEPVYAVAALPSGVVATGGGDDRALLWHSATSDGEPHLLSGHTDSVAAVAFRRVARPRCSPVAEDCVVPTARCSLPLAWMERHFSGASASPVPFVCALTARRRDAPTGGFLRALEGSGGGFDWLQWHPRGHVLLAGSEDFTAWLWNADDGACMQARVAPALSGSIHAPTVACVLTFPSACAGFLWSQRRRHLRRFHDRRPQRVHSLGGCKVSLRACLPSPARPSDSLHLTSQPAAVESAERRMHAARPGTRPSGLTPVPTPSFAEPCSCVGLWLSRGPCHVPGHARHRQRRNHRF